MSATYFRPRLSHMSCVSRSVSYIHTLHIRSRDLFRKLLNFDVSAATPLEVKKVKT